MKPTTHEIEVLEMLDGRRPGEWGAWVGACLESLQAAGLCTRGASPCITPAGRAELESHPASKGGGVDGELPPR